MFLLNGSLRLTQGILRSKNGVRTWIAWLIVVNLVWPFFLLPSGVAVTVIISFAVGAVAMATLCGAFGFTRVLGMAHLAWIPGFVALFAAVGSADFSTRFGQWVIITLITNIIAVAFDVWDAFRYFNGDQNEIDTGLPKPTN